MCAERRELIILSDWSSVMNNLRPLPLIVIFCLFCSLAWPQYHGPIGTRQGKKRWAEPPEQRSTIQLHNAPDARELKKDADELARLSQSVPVDVEALNRGVVSKDLNEKLRRIEKLSKKLRSQIQP